MRLDVVKIRGGDGEPNKKVMFMKLYVDKRK